MQVAGTPVRVHDEAACARLRRQHLGFVFQGFNLLSRTSALDNVELPLLYHGGKSFKKAERRRMAMESLTAVGLGQRFDHHPNQIGRAHV